MVSSFSEAQSFADMIRCKPNHTQCRMYEDSPRLLQADADRAAAEARAAADARAAAAAADLVSTEQAPPPALAPGQPAPPPQASDAAQLEQSLVRACVTAIRRALPTPQQLDLAAIVQAVNSGIASGDTMATFVAATDDIVVELQRIAEAVDAAPPEQVPDKLAAMADYIETNLTDRLRPGSAASKRSSRLWPIASKRS
ncbi:hypothetical protein KFL_000060180 [Klebsormidium nitens]|uniref:Uncharacterized protein n=1 Tax=Klebsormidium nitens TaxID=105231 RepID=A0A0U9HHX8_KLENI|nr:hypothetical protein KFL_000060180 [Klebsormidium nitens]|eukprot:GAQ77953.1 hypothetical protein KFL_000060180 [Klebsormidium nitens]